MDLFKPNAPWRVGSSRATAFKISTQLVLRGTDEQLRTVFEGLRQRHVGLAIELAVLVGTDVCGKGTEGFGSPLAVGRGTDQQPGRRAQLRRPGRAGDLGPRQAGQEQAGQRLLSV